MPVPTNPYVAGNPVGNSPAFVGREDVLREVLRMLRSANQNAITLYGQRRIGKTSVLQWLNTRLPAEGPFLPVYLDLQDKAAWTLGRVLVDLARVIAGRLGLPNPELGREVEATFRKEWLPQAILRLPAETSLVLLFDEFDVLADPKTQKAVSSFFPYLRDLLTLEPTRLKFVFVLGRNITDLSSIALSLFKGTPSKRVSLLAEKDARKLIRLSEANHSLEWSDEAVDQAWALAHGHPYLTQSLCSQVWDLAYEAHEQPPPVLAEDVGAAAAPALEASRNTLEWLWDGLGPAERVVISALAQAGARAVDENELEQILRDSGVRIMIRELQNAPKTLQDWDLIEPAEGGYCFRVELLRRWIVEYRPLSRVQEELDRIQPLADALFQAAQGFYLKNDLGQAESLLRQALNANPNHTRANDLLAEMLIARGLLAEARDLLEKYLEYAPQNARPRLVQVYLAQAQASQDQMEQLALYEKALALEANNQEARTRRREILGARGLAQIEELQKEKRFAQALDVATQMQQAFPDDPAWLGRVELLKQQVGLADLYQRALEALQKQDQATAAALLVQVVSRQVDYEQATRYLYQAVSGEDVALLRTGLEKSQTAYRQSFENQTATQTATQKEQADLQARLEKSEKERQRLLEESRMRLSPVELVRQVGVQKWLISILSIVVLLLLATNIIGWYLVVDSQINQPTVIVASETATLTTPWAPTITQPAATEPAATLPADSSWTRPADEMTMRLVLAGEFQMGSDQGGSKEQPVHSVFTDAFWIDEHEVTNAMYTLCVSAGECSAPGGSTFEDAQLANHPVVNVSWEQASQYCEWAGARLPTEAEWEKAGRGGLEGKTYPWGDETPTCTLGAVNGAQYDACDGDTVPVKSFGPNGFGLYDMAGNVWEWTADWYDGYTASPASDPTGPVSGDYRVQRGGSWYYRENDVRVAGRGWDRPDVILYSIGFRCSRSHSPDTQPVSTATVPAATPTQPVTTQPVTTPLPDSSWTRPADGMTMRLIPAGEFQMGSETGESDEQPVHTVFLDAFWIDEHEVTNAMYTMCFEVGACDKPGDMELASHPVVKVSWEQAGKYCEWVGARLPTEAEWEKAGRGGLEGKTYPWGDETPTCTLGAVNGAQYDACDGDTVPVKSFGPNGFGLYDMAGNVWEWMADWYDESFYKALPASDPTGPASGDYRVLRGGSGLTNEYDVRVAARDRYLPDVIRYSIGFRCSRSP